MDAVTKSKENLHKSQEPPRISAETLYCQNLESLGYIFVADSMGLSSFKFSWWPPRKFSKHMRLSKPGLGKTHVLKQCVKALQGHPRSPPLFHPNFRGVPEDLRSSEPQHRQTSPRSEDPKLIIRVINFELIQPIFPGYISVTDGRTDGRTTYNSNTALALMNEELAVRHFP